ncbi:formate C-acetyltransferase/glycerol dehydratase family glycyl radical enzyme, partial [Escherichia coli]
DKIIFYRSVILTSEGIIRFANRYAEAAELMAKEERDEKRREELLNIAANCRKVPENPPETFYEAIQFVWFTQIGGILSENPLSL